MPPSRPVKSKVNKPVSIFQLLRKVKSQKSKWAILRDPPLQVITETLDSTIHAIFVYVCRELETLTSTVFLVWPLPRHAARGLGSVSKAAAEAETGAAGGGEGGGTGGVRTAARAALLVAGMWWKSAEVFAFVH